MSNTLPSTAKYADNCYWGQLRPGDIVIKTTTVTTIVYRLLIVETIYNDRIRTLRIDKPNANICTDTERWLLDRWMMCHLKLSDTDEK